MVPFVSTELVCVPRYADCIFWMLDESRSCSTTFYMNGSPGGDWAVVIQCCSMKAWFLLSWGNTGISSWNVPCY